MGAAAPVRVGAAGVRVGSGGPHCGRVGAGDSKRADHSAARVCAADGTCCGECCARRNQYACKCGTPCEHSSPRMRVDSQHTPHRGACGAAGLSQHAQVIQRGAFPGGDAQRLLETCFCYAPLLLLAAHVHLSISHQVAHAHPATRNGVRQLLAALIVTPRLHRPCQCSAALMHKGTEFHKGVIQELAEPLRELLHSRSGSRLGSRGMHMLQRGMSAPLSPFGKRAHAYWPQLTPQVLNGLVEASLPQQ